MFGLTSYELKMTLVVLLIQFVNIVDFMMVMPLGPDFAVALGIPLGSLGVITAAYVGAAAIITFATARYMDRLPRRELLVACLVGLGTTALLTPVLGQLFGLNGLLIGRALAGLFGGPATSLALTVLADAIPADKRGRSMGIASGAFSVSAVIGVPFGLELARLGDWTLPFQALGGVALVVSLFTWWAIPSHLQTRRTSHWPGTRQFLSRRKTALALGLMFVTPLSGFLFIPNMATYFQFNLGYPRELMGLLYAAGGTCALFSMQIAGAAIDRFGLLPAARILGAGAAVVAILLFGFTPLLAPIVVLFSGLMIFNSARNVLANTASSLVPTPDERGAHMAFQGTVRHIGSGVGAMTGAFILDTGADGTLLNVPILLTLYVITLCLQPLLTQLLTRRLKSEQSEQVDAV
jgi:predicted MFS family arabinose efflux permease